jgi:hypothetical protein
VVAAQVDKERTVQSSTVISQDHTIIFHLSSKIERQKIPLSIFAAARRLAPYPAKFNNNSAILDVS